MEKNQMVSEAFKAAVLGFVQSQSLRDEIFAKRAELPTKSVDECCRYILGEVSASGRYGFHDDEIFGMVVHYYTEDEIQVKEAPACKVVVNAPVELTEEEKQEARRQAIQQYKEEELGKLRNSNRNRKVGQMTTEAQPSLFE